RPLGRSPRGPLGRRGGLRGAVEGPGERNRGRLRAVPPRTHSPLAPARRAHGMTPKPKTHKDAVDYVPVDWTGVYPPEFGRKTVPNHVAIVMDGNGRWANSKGLTRVEGHKAGEASLLDVVAGA